MDSVNEDQNVSFGSSPDAPQSTASLFGYALFALGLALFIRFFIAAPFIVYGSSMDDTFHQYDYLIIDRISYRFDDPQRGDVIVFGLPQDTSRDLIKRVIALPGETIILENGSISISNADHPEGFALSEPYITPANRGGLSDLSVTLGEEQYFVLGDNRRVSADSRIWGTLPRADIIGRVLVRLFPFSQIASLPGTARY